AGEGCGGGTFYGWKGVKKKEEEEKKTDAEATTSKESAPATPAAANQVGSPIDSDVVLTSFAGWDDLAKALQASFGANAGAAPEVRVKAEELTRGATSVDDKLRALYD